MKTPFKNLEPFSEEEKDAANVIIDTPMHSRNKFKYDEKLKLFKLSHVLTAGLVFPFNFGFIPGTKGGDGDPLDVLVLTEEPVFTGCLIVTRIIGSIEANQTQEGKTNRNDRFIGVAVKSREYADIRDLSQIGEKLIDEIEHFFISYNIMRNRTFKPLRRLNAQDAVKLVKESG